MHPLLAESALYQSLGPMPESKRTGLCNKDRFFCNDIRSFGTDDMPYGHEICFADDIRFAYAGTVEAAAARWLDILNRYTLRVCRYGRGRLIATIFVLREEI